MHNPCERQNRPICHNGKPHAADQCFLAHVPARRRFLHFGSQGPVPVTGADLPSLAEGFYTSEVSAPRAWPLRTFLPIGYEPNYPYPLLVFLHGHRSSEEQILRLAPRLSRRNYICIGLRGPQLAGPSDDGEPRYTWPEGRNDALVEDYVFEAVEQTRRTYHVHSERIYLAGICEGATLAYRLSLTFPEKLAGVISLNGMMPRHGGPLLRLPEVRQLRAFIGHGIANALVPLASARQDFRLLYTAGLAVRMETYPTTHRLHPDMLRDINRWIMETINDEG
jgi:phospholipase/carboxylesterase